MTDQRKCSLNETIAGLNSNSRISQCLVELRDRVVTSQPNRDEWPSLADFKNQLSQELRATHQLESASDTDCPATLVVA
ncbi:hypothetical protein [Thalassoroseus pseudoceratinae]|uniref:hypothetical protein n=1 Tax=Thalassoroseus pseudoceratinae TaxID=2713176 RepID=UPI00141EBCB4|nr:hypothetical protein [Thalassoroseus pseudoceratinae]